jgi:hypothetical protein
MDFLDSQYGIHHYDELALSAPLQRTRKVSRQAATVTLGKLVDMKVLREGTGQKPKTYKLHHVLVFEKSYSLEGLEEHVVWQHDIAPILKPYVTDSGLRIWSYGVTEMVNNAIDHSEGKTVRVALHLNAVGARCIISDDGEGIFRRIARICKLSDERQAILELSKGKLTTDPARHSGEGLFFTSRAFDWFTVTSGGLYFSHQDGDTSDILMEDDVTKEGTTVDLHLNHRTKRSLEELFNRFADPEEFTFTKTIVPVRLAKLGEEGLVSRSQANRLLARVDRFETVVLDFEGVETVGQAFADEIFRVYVNAHPDIKIVPINENAYVHAMIVRAQKHKS